MSCGKLFLVQKPRLRDLLRSFWQKIWKAICDFYEWLWGSSHEADLSDVEMSEELLRRVDRNLSIQQQAKQALELLDNDHKMPSRLKDVLRSRIRKNLVRVLK